MSYCGKPRDGVIGESLPDDFVEVFGGVAIRCGALRGGWPTEDGEQWKNKRVPIPAFNYCPAL
jgi:hypothetical protein